MEKNARGTGPDALPIGALRWEQSRHLTAVAQSPAQSSPMVAEALLADAAGLGHEIALGRRIAEHPRADLSLAIAWAAENGRLDCLRMALQAHGDAYGEAMEKTAARAADLRQAGSFALLTRQASARQIGDLMDRCCERDDAPGVEALLPHPLADPLGTLADGRDFPLQRASLMRAASCALAMANWLARHPPDDPELLSTAIALCVEGGCAEAAMALSALPCPKEPALRAAARQGSLECLTALIPLANVDELGPDGLRAIDLAARGRRTNHPAQHPKAIQAEEEDMALARALIDAGADLGPNGRGSTPWEIAASAGRSSMARMLLARSEAGLMRECVSQASAPSLSAPRI